MGTKHTRTTQSGRYRLLLQASLRKARETVLQVPRAYVRARATADDYAGAPPILLTAVPKAGTHLAYQICAALPGVIDWGTFLVARPPLRRYFLQVGRPRDPAVLSTKVHRACPGELIRAHLPYTPEIRSAADRTGALIVAVVRDPRALVVSVAHYVAHAAPWHPAHRLFAPMTQRERLEAAVRGVRGHEAVFPDVSARLRGFIDWSVQADVVLRYEDLRTRPDEAVRGLVAAYRARSRGAWSVPDATDAAVAAIEPTASHTFRKGSVDAWREELPEYLIEETQVATREYMQAFHYECVDCARAAS